MNFSSLSTPQPIQIRGRISNGFAKHAVLALSLLFALIAGGAQAENPEAVNALLNQGDYAKALVEVDKALAADPDSSRLKLQKGFILIRLRDLDEAESYYNGLVEQMPDNPEPMNNLGVIYQLDRQYSRAIEQLRATIDKFPDFGRAYENLGDTYIQMASDSYAEGRERINNDPMLVSKADLGQRFYGLARANQESAMQRFTGAANGTSESGSQEAGTATDNTAQSSDAGTASSGTNTEQEIADFLREWVVAWSGQNLDDYFARYGEDFKPSGGISMNAWKDRKQRVISAAKFINIRVESIEVLEQTGDEMKIRFNQKYESNTYKSESPKTLDLKRYSDGWKIISEN